MKLNRILGVLFCILCMVSCGTVQTNKPFAVGSVRLEMSMDDLNYLGESEISVEYDTYLGFITKIRKVNGELYDPLNTRKLTIPTQGLALSSEGMDLAAYKVLEDYPQATFFQVVFERTEKEQLFLGSVKKTTAKVRAYSFK